MPISNTQNSCKNDKLYRSLPHRFNRLGGVWSSRYSDGGISNLMPELTTQTIPPPLYRTTARHEDPRAVESCLKCVDCLFWYSTIPGTSTRYQVYSEMFYASVSKTLAPLDCLCFLRSSLVCLRRNPRF